MLCREANEAHLALLSTLPPHMAASAALLGAPIFNPENDAQQIQNEKMIREFKTLPCGLEGSSSSHDHRCCPFFHSERDRRRLVLGTPSTGALYTAEPCDEQFDDQRICSHGDGCGLCHSTAELLYHPDFFRKRLCHQAKRCPRGRFCAFAHSRGELLVPHFTEMEELEPTEDFIAWRFKTQWCPIGGPHDWENCVYAHTYRDWRRVPTLGYSSRPCPHWVQSVTSGPAELTYADRCPRGMSCPLAHGAKEQLYHPQFYKTSPCSEANCKRGVLCAFTHGAHDIRKPRADEQLPSSVRDPILQAVELLGRSQPTFFSPPRYHALEEPPRNSTSSCHSKGRSRGGSSSSLSIKQQQDLARWSDGSPMNGSMDASYGEMQMLPPAMPSIGNGQGAGGHSPQGYSPYGMPAQYPMCQWVPMGSEPTTQLIPPAMGYGQMPMDAQWGMSMGGMGYAPWGCNPYMQPQQMGMQPGMQQSCFMTMPTSPQHSDQANHVLEELTGEQDGMSKPDGSPQSLHGTDMNGFGMPPMDLSEMSGILSSLPDLYGALTMNGGMPAWPASDEEDILSGRANHYLRKGLRTPSSLGSPPLSAAPTSVPSPRPIEVDSNGSNCNEGSSDDARAYGAETSADSATHVLNLMNIKDGAVPPHFYQAAIQATTPAAKMPTIEHMAEPLALHNFAEAPCPASPSR